MAARTTLAAIIKPGDVIDVRARVRRVFFNEIGYEVIAWIDNPHTGGFQQICIPIEAVVIVKGPAIVGETGDLDRLTGKFLRADDG